MLNAMPDYDANDDRRRQYEQKTMAGGGTGIDRPFSNVLTIDPTVLDTSAGSLTARALNQSSSPPSQSRYTVNSISGRVSESLSSAATELTNNLRSLKYEPAPGKVGMAPVLETVNETVMDTGHEELDVNHESNRTNEDGTAIEISAEEGQNKSSMKVEVESQGPCSLPVACEGLALEHSSNI